MSPSEAAKVPGPGTDLRPIYVDLDDVLAQTVRRLVSLLEEISGRRVPIDDIRHFDLARSFGLDSEAYEDFMRAVHRDDVLERLEPVPGAADALRTWSDAGYEIRVLTGRPPETAAVTRRWLDRNDLWHGHLECVDKYGRGHGGTPLDGLRHRRFALAVEDSAEIAAFLARHACARVALLDRPWNRVLPALDEAARERIVRVAGWEEIARRFGRP